MILIRNGKAEALCKKVIAGFDRIVPGFYDPEDVRRGSIETVDRQRNRKKFPFMQIAIGAVSDGGGQFDSLGMVNQVCEEVLRKAEKNEGSAYLLDRRRKAGGKEG